MESTVSYKCPNCDAGLTFDAAKQKFTCEFCLSEFTKEELDQTASAERAEKAAQSDAAFSDEVREYHCPNCGAEVLADPSTAADFCYYCHNPIVLSDKVSGARRPDKIIPFLFDKKKAQEIFRNFVKKKYFLPNDFKSQEQAEKICGVYYPFWVTDADTTADFHAIGRRTHTWRQGDYMYVKTSRYGIERAGNIHFEDITSSAISTEDKKMLEGILPYPPDAHKPFDMAYLLGYLAKKRDIERDALTEEVRGRMNKYAEDILFGTVSPYGSVTDRQTSVQIHKSHWEYTLFPIWILTYRKQQKTYLYAMNGHTGKIYGNLPVSFAKLAALFAAIAIPLAALTTLIGGLWF